MFTTAAPEIFSTDVPDYHEAYGQGSHAAGHFLADLSDRFGEATREMALAVHAEHEAIRLGRRSPDESYQDAFQARLAWWLDQEFPLDRPENFELFGYDPALAG